VGLETHQFTLAVRPSVLRPRSTTGDCRGFGGAVGTLPIPVAPNVRKATWFCAPTAQPSAARFWRSGCGVRRECSPGEEARAAANHCAHDDGDTMAKISLPSRPFRFARGAVGSAADESRWFARPSLAFQSGVRNVRDVAADDPRPNQARIRDGGIGDSGCIADLGHVPTSKAGLYVSASSSRIQRGRISPTHRGSCSVTTKERPAAKMLSYLWVALRVVPILRGS